GALQAALYPIRPDFKNGQDVRSRTAANSIRPPGGRGHGKRLAGDAKGTADGGLPFPETRKQPPGAGRNVRARTGVAGRFGGAGSRGRRSDGKRGSPRNGVSRTPLGRPGARNVYRGAKRKRVVSHRPARRA